MNADEQRQIRSLSHAARAYATEAAKYEPDEPEHAALAQQSERVRDELARLQAALARATSASRMPRWKVVKYESTGEWLARSLTPPRKWGVTARLFPRGRWDQAQDYADSKTREPAGAYDWTNHWENR